MKFGWNVVPWLAAVLFVVFALPRLMPFGWGFVLVAVIVFGAVFLIPIIIAMLSIIFAMEPEEKNELDDY